MASSQFLTLAFEINYDGRNQEVAQFCGCFYGKMSSPQPLVDNDNNDQTENFGENLLKLTKRRPPPKANLAGLWGVPTRFF